MMFKILIFVNNINGDNMFLFKATLSEEKNKKLSEIYDNSNFIFYNYITSQILDGFIVGIIVSTPTCLFTSVFDFI